MKQIIIKIIVLSVCLGSVPSAFSSWYGNFTQSINSGAGITWCNEDGDITGGRPSFSRNPITGTYSYDSRIISSTASSITCERWDNFFPEGISINFVSGPKNGSTIWTNTSAQVNIQAKDRGGSTITSMVLERSENEVSFSTVATWNNIVSSNNIIENRTFYQTFQQGKRYKYRLRVTDIAGNITVGGLSGLLGFDSLQPTIGNIGLTTPQVGAYFKASSNKNVTINISNAGGSDIASISYRVENPSTGTLGSIFTVNRGTQPGSFIDLVGSTNFTQSLDMRNVDFQKNVNNTREYLYIITQICDIAGNCGTVNRSNIYNIYADFIDNTKTQKLSPFGGEKIADGKDQVYQIELFDRFMNKILPVKQINGTQIRTVDTKIVYSSDLYLDQYRQSGDGAVSFQMTTDSNGFVDTQIGTSLVMSGFQSNTGNNLSRYDINTKVYTPTQNNNQGGASGGFTIESIAIASSDEAGVEHQILNIPEVFQYRPYLYTNFSGDIFDDGFIEGTTQNGSIALNKNGLQTGISNQQIGLEFGTDVLNLPVLSLDFQLSLPNELSIGEGNGNKTTIGFIPVSSGTQFTSIMSQVPGIPIVQDQKTYLSSHISYLLDAKQVVYNSDIIGKNNYINGVEGENNTFQSGLKILGISATGEGKQTDIIVGQDKNLNIIGSIYKGELKRDIKKGVYNFIKYLPDAVNTNSVVRSNFDSFLNGGNTLGKDKNILYFGKTLAADYVEISLGSTQDITGQKTIVVVGSDIYITQDILLGDKVTDILGIMSLKDEQGKGGNVYIHPSVSQIYALIYAEKAVLSFDGTNELSIDTPQFILKDQLYIYGSVFSENSIGGSRNSPLVCPYYKRSKPGYVCDIKESQKYDLNYLRRYVLGKGIDTNGDNIISENERIPINGGITAVGNNSVYYKYPVIIEYNPKVQSGPPPLFNK